MKDQALRPWQSFFAQGFPPRVRKAWQHVATIPNMKPPAARRWISVGICRRTQGCAWLGPCDIHMRMISIGTPVQNIWMNKPTWKTLPTRICACAMVGSSTGFARNHWIGTAHESTQKPRTWHHAKNMKTPLPP